MINNVVVFWKYMVDVKYKVLIEAFLQGSKNGDILIKVEVWT